MFTGEVLELHRWPVKSLAGEPSRAVRVDGRGVAGDRTHALFDIHKGEPRRLTARQCPRLLLWSAAYPGAPDETARPESPPEPILTAPDGRRLTWGDADLPHHLTQDLGRAVTLHRDPAGQQDLERSVLVTTDATLRAVGRDVGRALDLRRFRTNAHVRLDAAPFAEEDWAGGRLWIGDCELELLHPCRRCVIPTRDPDTVQRWAILLRWLFAHRAGVFGINARPAGPGMLRRGDPVRVQPPLSGGRVRPPPAPP